MPCFADGPMEPPAKTQYMADETAEQFAKQVPPGATLQKGEHGGTYYLTPSGEKVYVGGSGSGKQYPVAKPAPGGQPGNPFSLGPQAGAIDEGAYDRAGIKRPTIKPAAPKQPAPAKPQYPVAKPAPAAAAAQPARPAAQPQGTKMAPDTDVAVGSFPGDKEYAEAQKKRAELRASVGQGVKNAEEQLKQTEEYVKTAPITPTQKNRLIRARKHVIQDAKAMQKLFEEWEAHPEKRVTLPEAKQQFTEAQKALAEVQERFTRTYQDIVAAKAKKSRAKELKLIRKEAEEAAESREHARRVLQLSEAYAGKFVATHNPQMGTRVVR